MSRKSVKNGLLGGGETVGAYAVVWEAVSIAPDSKELARWRRHDWLFALALVIVTFTAYLPSWDGTPIWDDDGHLTRPELRSLEGLARIWTQPGATQQYYPLVHTLFWVEHCLWGDWPAGYHLLNILLHCASALLLVRLLRGLEIPGAWLAAAIFAVHPVQTESVAWISELKNMLSGVFYFGSMLSYLKFDRTRTPASFAVALVLLVLGLMSKTVVATLPAAMLVIFWWKRGKLLWKRDVLPLMPLFLLGTAAGLFTGRLEGSLIGAKGSDFNFSILERILIAGRVIWFYLGKIFWPLDLIFIYPRWQVSQTVWWQYLFPATVLLLVAVLTWLSRRCRAPLAGLLFFIGTLFPALGFLNVYPFRFSFVADHFQYLASLGIIVLVAAGITRLLQPRQLWRRAVGYLFCSALLASLTILTWRQSAMYSNNEALWRTTTEKNPESWMAQNNLGSVLLQKGQVDEAIVHFRDALEINADDVGAQANLGNALLQKGQLDEAIAHFYAALGIKGDYTELLSTDYAQVHCGLGYALLLKGQADEAIVHYQKALEIKPDDDDTENNLGIIFYQKGQLEPAIVHYQKAIEINPRNAHAAANLAWALATSPQTPTLYAVAVKLAQQVNQMTGGANSSVLQILAAAYAQTGQFPQAMETAKRSLQLAMDQKNAGLEEALKTELVLYEKGQPFRARK
jgi:tetratricopeptide (TPR) repeat protein